MILRKEATGEPISPEDAAFRADYENTEDYAAMQHIFEAELNYMKFQHQRRVNG